MGGGREGGRQRSVLRLCGSTMRLLFSLLLREYMIC